MIQFLFLLCNHNYTGTFIVITDDIHLFTNNCACTSTFLSFTQYLYPYITTPMFTLNSAWDTWQLKNTLELNCHPDECPPEEKKQFEDYGKVKLL